nr:MAG TPA: hypothetical protein [Caudoviricetes sp.]
MCCRRWENRRVREISIYTRTPSRPTILFSPFYLPSPAET